MNAHYPDAKFVIVWEFRAPAGRRSEFEKAYGDGGVWAQFFRQRDGYAGIELLRDQADPLRYFTLDVWQSREAYDQFRRDHLAQYREIDRQCEALTEEETKIGEFESLAAAHTAIAAFGRRAEPVNGSGVRAAKPGDIPSIIALERRTSHAGHWPDAAYRQMFEAQAVPRIALVISGNQAGEDRDVSAFLIARVAETECELENIVVSEPSQRRGFAFQLIESLASAVREYRVGRIFLEVRESNAAARALYERCGFKATGRRPSYYSAPAEDAITYARTV